MKTGLPTILAYQTFLAIKNRQFSEKTFLLADSHGLHLYDYPKQYGVKNFSFAGDSYVDLYRKLDFLLRNAQVDTVLLTVDDHILGTYRDFNNNHNRSIYYASSSCFKNSYEFMKEKHLRYNIALFQPEVALLLRRKFFVNYFQWIDLKENKKETKVNWSVLNKKDRVKKSRNRAFLQFDGHQKSQTQEDALDSIIVLCKKHQVELIGLKFPLAKEYLDILEGRNFGADSIFHTHNLPVLDFTTLYIEQSEMFINQDHLNDRGAQAFTEVLFAALKRK